MGLIRLVACGSVDDGKSTLIGRLLADTDSVPEDTLELARTVRRAGSTIPAGEIDYSLLTDGLEAEREQGITIDVAYRHMALPDGRRVVIADAPGHEQYTRNMAVAASTADVALLLVDAARGVHPPDLPAPDDLRSHGRASRDHRGQQARRRRLRPRPVL